MKHLTAIEYDRAMSAVETLVQKGYTFALDDTPGVGMVAHWMPPFALPQKPIDMVLYCPKCGTQHVDRPDTPEDGADWNDPEIAWTNPPHRSHLCHSCGCIWRPADVPTNGVASIETQGKDDTWFGGWSGRAVAPNWTPTAENINALPNPIRRYIYDLETKADPTGIVRQLTIATDMIRALEVSNGMLREKVRQGVPKGTHIAGIGFRWDAERIHQVPQLLVEFEPVLPDSADDAKGWVDRDTVADMFNARPSPEATQPTRAEAPSGEKWCVSQDPLTQLQVASVLALRDGATQPTQAEAPSEFERGLLQAVEDMNEGRAAKVHTFAQPPASQGEREKVSVTAAGLRKLAVLARLNGTVPAFADVALDWADAADTEIARLRATQPAPVQPEAVAQQVGATLRDARDKAASLLRHYGGHQETAEKLRTVIDALDATIDATRASGTEGGTK